MCTFQQKLFLDEFDLRHILNFTKKVPINEKILKKFDFFLADRKLLFQVSKCKIDRNF